MKILRLLLTMLLFAPAAAFAADNGAGTAGFAFLKIGMGSSQLAAGGAACATSKDANAAFWNPASIRSVEKAQISLSHNQWLGDVSAQSVSVCLPYGKEAYGFSVLYLHMDDIPGYDIDSQGNPVKIAAFTSYDMEGVFTYAREISGFEFGVNLKAFQEKIENSQANCVALDIGARKRLTSRLKAGAAVQNIGAAGKFINDDTPLPLNVKAGIACALADDKLTLSIDANKAADSGTKACFGADYSITKILSFRIGYNDKEGLNNWITAGMGIVVADWIMDYAYVPYGKLGDTHRISLTTGF